MFTLHVPRRCKNANAPAARFSTPTALYHLPTHRAAEDRIKNELQQQENSQAPVPKKEDFESCLARRMSTLRNYELWTNAERTDLPAYLKRRCPLGSLREGINYLFIFYLFFWLSLCGPGGVVYY